MTKLRFTGLLIFLSLLGLLPTRGAEPTAEIVVSMRYLQQTGASHAHLYLYRADGKLLRQLTSGTVEQDSAPVFAPGGEIIVFKRELPGSVKQCWSIEPRGGNLHQVAEPGWYTLAKTPPTFQDVCAGPPAEDGKWARRVVACTFPVADGKVEATLVPTPPADDDAPDHWEVRLGPVDGKPAKVGELPGFSAGFLSLQENEPARSRLHEGALDVVFCFTHLNSTDGDTVSALDLNARRVVRLSPNWAAVVALPGEAAFLTLTSNRYVPFGDGKHTANCTYAERWDAGLKAVRYAEGEKAGVCYGASIYRPGKTPATVTIRPQDGQN